MEDITDADYIYAKRVCKDFEIKILGVYHDLYLKSDFIKLCFRKMCSKIHHLDPVKFISFLIAYKYQLIILLQSF